MARAFVAILFVLNLTPACATARQYIAALFDLNAEQRAFVEQIGCRAAHGVALEYAYGESSARRDDEDMYVHGQCAPHGSFDGFPLKFEIDCRHAGGNWSCGPDLEVLYAEVAGQRVHIAADGVSMREALDIVKYLRSVDAWQAIAGDLMHPQPAYATCDVRARGPDKFVADCGSPSIEVERVPGGTGYQRIPDPKK